MAMMTQPDPPGGNPVGQQDASVKSGKIVAKVPQGYETKVNFRLVPARDIQLTPGARQCRPRQGPPHRVAGLPVLPEGLVAKLRDANKKVIGWLSQDPSNARLFLARPVEALLKAGVELTRAEQKALDRSHRAVKETAVVGPGVKVVDLSASGYPNGRVGKVKPATKPESGKQQDSGCGPNGKE